MEAKPDKHHKIGTDCSCLDCLLYLARDYKQTEAERRAQVVSFAYGNLKLDGCDVTLEGVALCVQSVAPKG